MSDETEMILANGAHFFDAKERPLGWARRVTKRPPALTMLTVFDVQGAEPGLSKSLVVLDQSRLHIRTDDLDGKSYFFKWASGYGNGADLRIQGVLEPG